MLVQAGKTLNIYGVSDLLKHGNWHPLGYKVSPEFHRAFTTYFYSNK